MMPKPVIKKNATITVIIPERSYLKIKEQRSASKGANKGTTEGLQCRTPWHGQDQQTTFPKVIFCFSNGAKSTATVAPLDDVVPYNLMRSQ